MATILGSGAYRYEELDQWAKLPAGWSFHEVVDVAALSPNLDRVEDAPARVLADERLEPVADPFLALGADPPCAFFGVGAEHPSDEGLDRCLLT